MSVFVAWMPDEDALDALHTLCAAVDRALAPARPPAWRRPAQFHMTLRYLGEETPTDLAPLSAALAAVAARHARIALRFDDAEQWTRVLVARTALSATLDALFIDIEHAVRGCGFAPEPAEKAPHVTLAYAPREKRFGADVETAVRAALPFIAILGRIALVRTIPGGYDTLAWWPLDERDDGAIDAAGRPR